MTVIGLILLLVPVVTLVYAYLVYPAVLWCLGIVTRRRSRVGRAPDGLWPMITITIPVFNEERILRSTLEHVLSLEYPPERRHVLVMSDASTDGTDAIAREFSNRGVELVRLPARAGKTAAENAAAAHLQGEIVVNIDATARPAHDALAALIGAFADPTIGVASGRDVSIGAEAVQTVSGESGYVGYEMWVRGLETRVGSIVGASGCFYAIRRSLYASRFPEALSRDFASALIAQEHGYRAISVDAAVCAVPRAGSLDAEFHRKVRTMHRGLETLYYKRALLDPRLHGRFAWMLFSHKLCRWLVPLSLPVGVLGLVVLAPSSTFAAWLLGVGALGAGLSAAARRRPTPAGVLRLLAIPGYLLMTNVAGVMAWWHAIRQERDTMWEPTRRPA